MATDTGRDIRNRAFLFACQVARLALSLGVAPGIRCIVDQLLRAGTAVGANLEEAKAASTRRECVRYLEIALREAREALYWLRICSELQLGSDDQLRDLMNESDQVVRILTAIVINTKNRKAT
jgi:four helix bundle protein